ncbi:MAG: TrmH family RNA methyltransferase [Chloroflexota bacterium]
MCKTDFKQFLTERRLARLEATLSRRQPDLTVVLENINDPHNVSAALRSCDAVGVYEACLLYYGAQKFPKLGEASSASARKWVAQKRFSSVDECYADLRKRGMKIYTTHMSRDAVSLYDLDLTQPVALVFGNEHAGVSEEAAELADANFLIPQVGMIQSLNISVACAVSLYEAYRQRERAGAYETKKFDDESYARLLDDWSRI